MGGEGGIFGDDFDWINPHSDSGKYVTVLAEMEKIIDKEEVLQAECSCGQLGYIVVPDLWQEVKTKCPKCGRELWHVVCKKCESGYVVNVNDNKFFQSTSRWTCSMCKNENESRQEMQGLKFVTNYKDLPERLRKSVAGRDFSWQVRGWIIGLLVVGLGVLYWLGWWP